MIFAQIKNNLVMNVIVLENIEHAQAFLEGYDEIIDITEACPIPRIGDSYENGIFTVIPDIECHEDVGGCYHLLDPIEEPIEEEENPE